MSDLNISVEQHLVDLLVPLLACLPPETARQLDACLKSSTIPYSLLQSVSQWTRSDAGIDTLKSRSLSPADYSMIPLLAGATTSPERTFPAYVPPKDPEQIAAESARERKSITAIVNGLLSIIGSGAAAWWASGSAGWRDEWASALFYPNSSHLLHQRTLFALFVALLVTVSETVLYLLWQSASSSTKATKRGSAKHKKPDGGINQSLVIDRDKREIDHNTGLRHRLVQTNEEDQE